jgi:hypothetical protein
MAEECDSLLTDVDQDRRGDITLRTAEKQIPGTGII